MQNKISSSSSYALSVADQSLFVTTSDNVKDVSGVNLWNLKQK